MAAARMTGAFGHGRIPVAQALGLSEVEGPHRLVAQDVALSRPKRGFEAPWGHRCHALSPKGSPSLPLRSATGCFLSGRSAVATLGMLCEGLGGGGAHHEDPPSPTLRGAP